MAEAEQRKKQGSGEVEGKADRWALLDCLSGKSIRSMPGGRFVGDVDGP